ncbi:hypothetical protein [Streptomyces sp. NBC_01451]|nr:hypothetical protein [Streptomyces sp. NBC_01451]
MRSVEDSCQRLGILEIDFVFVHDTGSDRLGDTTHGSSSSTWQ